MSILRHYQARFEAGQEDKVLGFTRDISTKRGAMGLANDVKSALGAIDDFDGKLDVLINNAGVFEEQMTLTEENLELTFAVNVQAPFIITRELLPLLIHGKSKIINISSISGIVAGWNTAAYNSSKAGVRLLSKSVALYCAKKGYDVRCNSVHPSYTDTPMVDEIVSAHRNPMQYKIALEAASPMGRLGTPLDIAGAVVYLVSDEAKFVNGTEIVVDGGLTAT